MDKTITKMIEEIATDMWSHYCKKPEEWTKAHEGECGDEFFDEVCSKCPLQRLVQAEGK